VLFLDFLNLRLSLLEFSFSLRALVAISTPYHNSTIPLVSTYKVTVNISFCLCLGVLRPLLVFFHGFCMTCHLIIVFKDFVLFKLYHVLSVFHIKLWSVISIYSRFRWLFLLLWLEFPLRDGLLHYILLLDRLNKLVLIILLL
jgi:hypothetical protein